MTAQDHTRSFGGVSSISGLAGHYLMQHFHLLLDQLYAEIGHASDVTTRPAEAGDKSSRDRVYRR
jgi:hypothetical protein